VSVCSLRVLLLAGVVRPLSPHFIKFVMILAVIPLLRY
jgi:hypothetical protein